MSTATATTRPGRTTRTHSAYVPRFVDLIPAPCRMIAVEVFDEDGGKRAFSWSHVVGLMAAVEDWFEKRTPEGVHLPDVGSSPAEMAELGWRRCLPGDWCTEFYPVVVDGNSSEGMFRAIGTRVEECGNRPYVAVVPCHWPPDQDLENARRIARELVARDGNLGNWHDLETN